MTSACGKVSFTLVYTFNNEHLVKNERNKTKQKKMEKRERKKPHISPLVYFYVQRWTQKNKQRN